MNWMLLIAMTVTLIFAFIFAIIKYPRKKGVYCKKVSKKKDVISMIDKKYITDYRVNVPVEDCLLLDSCRYHSTTTFFSVIKGKRCFVLLAECRCLDSRNKTTDTKNASYVCGNFDSVIELNCSSLEELLEEKWDERIKKYTRKIDSITYSHYCTINR